MYEGCSPSAATRENACWEGERLSCAVLTAKRPSAEEDCYLRESYGNRMLYEYPTLKLWELDADALEESDNPFDWALCAGKRALEGGRDERLKLEYLKGFIDKLDAKGWTHDEKLAIFRLTDTLLHPGFPAIHNDGAERISLNQATIAL